MNRPSKIFDNQTMYQILIWCQDSIKDLEPKDRLYIQVPNPDLVSHHNPDSTLKYHSWRSWSDLATLLYCRMLTPQIIDEHYIVIGFQKLDISNSFHDSQSRNPQEKYGTDSSFSLIDKNKEPAFLSAFIGALWQVKIEDRRAILDLGINRADEFELIRSIVPPEIFAKMKLTGIDHSKSAIAKARETLPQENIDLICHDINQLDSLDLALSDLIISIGTLQSPNIKFKPLFMSLIQNYLKPDGAIILGFPNCRWIDGEMIYGAKAPNYNFSEMSLVIKDIYFCKKYLQQHKFRVTVTGKEYLFLTATKIGLQKKRASI